MAAAYPDRARLTRRGVRSLPGLDTLASPPS